MDIRTLGGQVRVRREALGLTQARLAKLAHLSRQTIQSLEGGTLKDLGFERIGKLLSVLGLSIEELSLAARKRKRGLWMAAKTSSVSYAGELTEEMLEQALATGHAPVGYEAHIGHLLDEAPVSLVVMAVEEAAAREHKAPGDIWRNVSKLATILADNRRALWL
ncbi:helix-turn-helix transcriptional regulator [Trinickia sp. EG282A]|uniref:helix-turn-helix transcriptional regulator n=1 Tax=Trinickia sp. EG282A TaxID=3237013 RepID=UPI0034D32AB1